MCSCLCIESIERTIQVAVDQAVEAAIPDDGKKPTKATSRQHENHRKVDPGIDF